MARRRPSSGKKANHGVHVVSWHQAYAVIVLTRANLEASMLRIRPDCKNARSDASYHDPAINVAVYFSTAAPSAGWGDGDPEPHDLFTNPVPLALNPQNTLCLEAMTACGDQQHGFLADRKRQGFL